MTPRPRSLDRARVYAFLASGAVWITGAFFGVATGPVLPLIAAAYVLPASLTLALVRQRIALTLAVLWGCAVALVAAVLAPVGGWLAAPAGLILGTVGFGLWAGAGFLLLHTFTREFPAPGPEQVAGSEGPERTV